MGDGVMMMNTTRLTDAAKDVVEALLSGQNLSAEYIYGDGGLPSTLLYRKTSPYPYEVELYTTPISEGDIIITYAPNGNHDGYLLIATDHITNTSAWGDYAEFILDNRVLLDDMDNWDTPSTVYAFFSKAGYQKAKDELDFSTVPVVLPVRVYDVEDVR